ncbi:MAG: transport system ATP-binding protein [Herbinix sp.]|jgi:ABC-2 type transport system ATP-binding protein|nr:transport system ATP-binding protein [Herbinix sp.]
MHAAIKVKNLTKSYGKKVVLRDVTFSVSQGETFALLGINGAGKTTTMNASRDYEDKVGDTSP